MKLWPTITILVLLTSGAAAQADYNWEFRGNRLGIFTTNVLPGHISPWPSCAAFNDLAKIEYTPYNQFSVYIMSCATDDPVLGFDASIILPPEVTALSIEPPPGTFWINLGTATNILSGYALPVMPDGNDNVHLATLNLRATAVVVDAIYMGPSEPSGIGGDGPTLNIGGEYMRANFINRTDGCVLDPPPVGIVAFFFDSVDACCGHPVATESHTLTSVKALYR